MTQKAPRAVTKPRGILERWPALATALVVALLAAGGYAWQRGYATRLLGASIADEKLQAGPRLSIVVLPFENLSGDKEQDYFADGITDDLTTDLSHLPDSFVISRGTAFTYKGKPVDTKQIGRELGVRYVLEGSVRRVGETITVNAQLISTETGAHVWADRFDGERSRLGELQVEFVSRLANSLGVELVKAEALRAARERPEQPGRGRPRDAWVGRAYNKRIRRRRILTRRSPTSSAPCNSTLSSRGRNSVWRGGLSIRAFSFRGGHATVDLPRAEALLTNALAKEPNNAWAHFVKADLLAYGKKQFDGALSELDVAIENDSNLAQAYDLRAAALLFSGEAKKAIPEDETALRLSPRDPFRNRWEFRICHAHAHMAEWETAVEWCQKSTATNAGFWLPYIDLAAANGWLGNEAEAKAAIAGLHKLMPGFTVQDWANIKWSDNPQFRREYARIVDGLRKAGLPEQ